MNTVLIIIIVVVVLLTLLEVDHFITIRRLIKDLDDRKQRFSELDNMEQEIPNEHE